MGDVNAVDFAPGSHLSVLQHAQAIPNHERVLHRQAPPRGPRQHALVIDDHLGLAVGERATSSSVVTMREAFDRGTEGCREAGLPHHPGKKVRGEVGGVALGGAVDAALGISDVASEFGDRFERAFKFLGVDEDAARIVGATAAAISSITIAPTIAQIKTGLEWFQ